MSAQITCVVERLIKMLSSLEQENLSEADTKRIIIEPILKVLGWDTTGIEDVRNEFRHRPSDNPVDYALLVDSKPSLFVEAKGLDQNIEERKSITQTVAYAGTCGVEWAVLTNGRDWAIYNALAKLDAEKKLFRRFTLRDPSAVSNLELLQKSEIKESRLNREWRLEYVGSQVKEELSRLLLEANKSLVRLVSKGCEGLDSKDIGEVLRNITLDLPEFKPRSKPVPTAKQPEAKANKRAVAGKNKPAIRELDEFFQAKAHDEEWFVRNYPDPRNLKTSRKMFGKGVTDIYLTPGFRGPRLGEVGNGWFYDRNLSSRTILGHLEVLRSMG